MLLLLLIRMVLWVLLLRVLVLPRVVLLLLLWVMLRVLLQMPRRVA